MSDTIIVDNGSSFYKACMASNETTRNVTRSVIGHLKYKNNGYKNHNYFIGEDALFRRGLCNLNFLNETAGKWNIDDNEILLHHIFYNELIKEKLAQLLFETFNVLGLYFGEKLFLSLLSTGRDAGIILHSGNDATYAYLVYDGYPIIKAIKSSNVGGSTITECIRNCINYKHFSSNSNKNASKGLASSPFLFNTLSDYEIVRDIKEKFSYVAFDYNQELELSQISTDKYAVYRFPDQTVLALQEELFAGPEILFTQQKKENSVDYLTYNSIMKCDKEIRRNLFGNIVLSGGTTMTEGFSERFTKEITALTPRKYRAKVIAPQDRNCSALTGGSILANSPSFEYEVVSHDEYNDCGPSIFRRKCIYFNN